MFDLLRRRGDSGGAVPEFLMVSIVLVFFAMLIVQAVLYVYVRNVVVASAAEGARYGVNANSDPREGSRVASRLIARGSSARVAAEIGCVASEEPGEGGSTLVMVRCVGDLPLFFVPLGDVLPIDVRVRVVKEGG